MSFCWEDFIKLSKELLESSRNNPLEAAYLRTSLSRSYYGVFCLARNYLITYKNIRIPRTDTHNFVRNEFINSQDDNERIVGSYLLGLWRYRKNADYENNYLSSYSTSRNMLSYANLALNTIKNLQT
jgi:uncharacterized protein (UPF0332 family)